MDHHKAQTPPTPSPQVQEMSATIDRYANRIYLLEQYILLTQGKKKLKKLRKRLKKAIPYSEELVGVSISEQMDRWN